MNKFRIIACAILISISLMAQQPVVGIGNQTFLSGQQSVTGSATVLPSNAVRQLCISALSTNVISVFIGPSGVTTSNGFELTPKAGVCFPITNSNLVYVVASTTGASVTWLGTT